MSIIVSDLQRVGKGNGKYIPSLDLQRRNPLNSKRVLPFQCRLCFKPRTYFKTINEIHGHCSYDHSNENFKPYLIQLVEQIFYGGLK